MKWECQAPLATNQYFFRYKYVILTADKELKAFERGADRIVDAEVLPEAEKVLVSQSANPSNRRTKKVELSDEWETYTVSFAVNFPATSSQDEVFLDISQKMIKEAPHFKHAGQLPLTKAPRDVRWLETKYGKPMRPWSIQLKFRNEVSTSAGGFPADDIIRDLQYHYVMKNF